MYPKVCVRAERGIFFGKEIIDYLESIGGKNHGVNDIPYIGNSYGEYYYIDSIGRIDFSSGVPYGYRLITKDEALHNSDGRGDVPPHTEADEPLQRYYYRVVGPAVEYDRKALLKRNIRVYIASPYTVGDVAVNVRRSIDCWNSLTDMGFFPYCPLLTHFIHMIHPRKYDEWIDIDLHWMLECNCVLRLPGESKGADAEVASALEHGMRVFYDAGEMLDFYSETCGK